MTKSTDFDWFIFTDGNAVINERVGRFLDQDVEERICEKTVCADGIRRDLWRVTRRELAELNRFFRPREVKLQIFVKKGKYGKIRPWADPNRPVLPSKLLARLASKRRQVA